MLSCRLFSLCSPMSSSWGYFYSACPYGAVKLMLRAQEEKEWKREAIILPIRKCFLLLFHTSEAHLQTIWILEICCETWGGASGPSSTLQGRGPSALHPLPSVPRLGFLYGFLYHTSASTSPSWPATPVLHYRAEHNTHTETGKLYFMCQPRSAP